eukprot:jgi/Chlat1/6049/Chrsp4S00491
MATGGSMSVDMELAAAGLSGLLGGQKTLGGTALLAAASAALLLVSAALLLILRRGRTKGAAPGKRKVVAGQLSHSAQEQADEQEDAAGRRRVLVLFGTQTGTAEGFARVVADEARSRYGARARVMIEDVEHYGGEGMKSIVSEPIVILLMATYGDGEPTDSAAVFCKWLEGQAAAADPDCALLAPTSFAVFGLGNRQYEQFNAVGKVVDASCYKLGGKRVLALGLGDDDDCIENDFSAWREKLWPALDPLFDEEDGNGLRKSFSAGPAVQTAPAEYKSIVHGANHPTAPCRFSTESKPAAPDLHHPVLVPVAVRKELHTPASERSCVHAEFDIRDSGLKYEHGDHIGVFAENAPALVEEAARLLGLDLDLVFSVVPREDQTEGFSPPFPCPCTVRTALAQYCELLTPPRKAGLLAMAAHAKDPADESRLRFLASNEGKDEYSRWVVEDLRSVLEVLAAFPSVRLPLGVFLASVVSPLQPRYYSISSSSRMHPDNIHVTAAVVRGPTPSGRLHEGVCSSWLSRAEPGTHIAPVFVRSTAFKLPSDSSAPIVMVGPGTGLAPFRGFLQERAARKAQGVSLGEAHLFFGCRDKLKDYIYQEELQKYAQDGAVTHLHVAFSREKGREKEYVQHQMMAKAAELWPLLSPKERGGLGGHLYVCGDAKAMAKDVHRALHSMVQQQECCSGNDAELIIKQMQQEGRYQRDVW